MFRSWITSFALIVALFAGCATVAKSQTGPINPPVSGPSYPGMTTPLDKDQLYNALHELDALVKRRDYGAENRPNCLYRLQVKVAGELRPILVDYLPAEKKIIIVAPLCMPFPAQQQLPADMQQRIAALNAEIAPSKVEQIKVGYSGESEELVLSTVLDGPTSLAEFQARLNQLVDSVGKTKPIWGSLPQK